MRRVIFLASTFLFMMSASTVQAETPAPSASALAEKAHRARDVGQLDEAIDGFARAYQISGDSSLLFFLAEAHREAGHTTDALRIFQTYVRRDPQGSHRETAERAIRELERRIEQESSGASSPSGSGKPEVEKKPMPAAATPSASEIRPAPMPAIAPAVAPAPAPVVPAAPERSAATGAERAPNPGADLTATPVAYTATARPSPPLPRWVPWVAVAVSVALGTGAIVSGVSASARYDDLRSSCGQTVEGCTPSQVDDVRSRARRANILWALAGVAAVGAGVTIYVNMHAAGLSGVWRF